MSYIYFNIWILELKLEFEFFPCIFGSDITPRSEDRLKRSQPQTPAVEYKDDVDEEKGLPGPVAMKS